MTRAQLTGCPVCDSLGREIPDEEGTYAFDGIGGATICRTERGSVIVHYPDVGEDGY